MNSSELKIGNKLTLTFRATITTASVNNDNRKPVVREVSEIIYNNNGVPDYIKFKGMKSEYRLCGTENFWLYSITGPTREYLVS